VFNKIEERTMTKQIRILLDITVKRLNSRFTICSMAFVMYICILYLVFDHDCE
jgi:hypothetical protein